MHLVKTAVALSFGLCSLASSAAPMRYPAAPRGDVADDYFGTRVSDPYRWLEDVDAPGTVAWVKAQQALTDPFLTALPERPALLARLKALWDYERRSAPVLCGGSAYYLHRDGLQNQWVLFQQTGNAEPRVLLDPNGLAADGTVAMTQFELAHSGSRFAYLLAAAGSDWETLHVRDIASGKDVADVLTRIKFSGLAWTRDDRALLYSTYPAPAATATAGKTRSRPSSRSPATPSICTRWASRRAPTR